MPEGSMQGKCYRLWKVKNSSSQSQVEQSKFLEEISIWEHPHNSGTAQTEEKNEVIFKETQKGLLQHHVKTHHGMMVKPKMMFGLFHEISLTACRLEESFPIPLKYIAVTRTTDTTLDVMSYKHFEDYRNVDGDGQVSQDSLFWVKNPQDGKTWSEWRLTRKQTTSRPDNVWPDLWEHMSDASKPKVNQKVGSKARLPSSWNHNFQNSKVELYSEATL